MAYIVGGALLAAWRCSCSHRTLAACKCVHAAGWLIRAATSGCVPRSQTMSRQLGELVPRRSAVGDAWFRAPRESRRPRTGSPQIPPRIRVDVAEFAQAQQVESGMAGHGAGGLTSLGGLDAIV